MSVIYNNHNERLKKVIGSSAFIYCGLEIKCFKIWFGVELSDSKYDI